MAEEDPIPRRRGTSTHNIDGFYDLLGDDSALTEGDKAWGRTSYTMRSDGVYEEGGGNVTELMKEFVSILAECKDTLIREWENFEAAYNTIFANQETPGITELANLFAAKTSTEFLPRVAGAVASAYNEAFGETAQIDASQVADLAQSPLGDTHGSNVDSGDLSDLNIDILQKAPSLPTVRYI